MFEGGQKMESKVRRNPDSGKPAAVDDSIEYREAVRKQLNDEVKKIFDLEMQKAVQELVEVQRNSTRKIVEEYKAIIYQVVEEEKAEIWKKAETLKKSMLQYGL
jgi:hypothetical protein